MSPSKRLLFFIIVCIAVFFFLLVLYYLAWLILGREAVPEGYLVAIGVLSSATSTVAFLVGGFMAFRQLAEVANSRHLAVSDKLFEELNSDENIAARRWVFQNLPDDPSQGIKSLTPEGQVAVKRVLNSLDRVAFLTQAGWIPEELIMPWMHPMIAKSWEKLGPYVRYEQARRNEPYYYEKVCYLAERCHQWRIKNLDDVKIHWLEDAL
jgi:hypothetical protein